jgi:hypothetical protein
MELNFFAKNWLATSLAMIVMKSFLQLKINFCGYKKATKRSSFCNLQK